MSEWIPIHNVSELPADDTILVTHESEDLRYVDTVYWDMRKWSDDVHDVTAYMPLPKPYREDGDTE